MIQTKQCSFKNFPAPQRETQSNWQLSHTLSLPVPLSLRSHTLYFPSVTCDVVSDSITLQETKDIMVVNYLNLRAPFTWRWRLTIMSRGSGVAKDSVTFWDWTDNLNSGDDIAEIFKLPPLNVFSSDRFNKCKPTYSCTKSIIVNYPHIHPPLMLPHPCCLESSRLLKAEIVCGEVYNIGRVHVLWGHWGHSCYCCFITRLRVSLAFHRTWPLDSLSVVLTMFLGIESVWDRNSFGFS